jgi:hypothetical protein
MNIYRILPLGLLLTFNVSFGQVNNYGVTIDGKYYNNEQLDSMLFAKEIDDIVRNLSTSRQSVNLESKKKNSARTREIKDPTLRKARDLFDIEKIDAEKIAPGEPMPLIEIKSPQSFGLHETDYYRFKESPCYEDLGFTPNKIGTPGYQDQLKNYQECEKEKIIKKIGIAALVVFLIIITIPTSKSIKSHLLSLKEKRQNKPLEIEEALNKLEQLQKAVDSGLISESTFQEMKGAIQSRIKKNL